MPEVLLGHIRALRLKHTRPVGFSCRQAADVIGMGKSSAATCLKELCRVGKLIPITVGTNETRHSTEYDLPEFVRSEVSTPKPKTKPIFVPSALPDWGNTPADFVPIAVWNGRIVDWRKCGIFARETLDLAYESIRKQFRRARYIAVGDQIIHQRGTGKGRSVRSWTTTPSIQN